MRVVWMKRVLLVALLVVGSCAAGGEPEAFDVQDIRAHLFYEYSGHLSEDITQKTQPVLWNTPLGEGDAAEPANDVLVVVEVRGPRRHFSPEQQLRLEVMTEDRERRLFNETRAVGLTGPDGCWATAFLLRDSTCQSLVLEAEVSGNDQPYSETIQFKCGE